MVLSVLFSWIYKLRIRIVSIFKFDIRFKYSIHRFGFPQFVFHVSCFYALRFTLKLYIYLRNIKTSYFAVPNNCSFGVLSCEN